MGFLENKKILIAGVASDRSIATGTALAMAKQGPNWPLLIRQKSCRNV